MLWFTSKFSGVAKDYLAKRACKTRICKKFSTFDNVDVKVKNICRFDFYLKQKKQSFL